MIDRTWSRFKLLLESGVDVEVHSSNFPYVRLEALANAANEGNATLTVFEEGNLRDWQITKLSELGVSIFVSDDDEYEEDDE